MKFARESAKVVWTADEHMAYYNLPPQMVQHWTYVHELNGYLMELVRSLSIGYRAAIFPLNPLAPVFECQGKKDTDKNNTTENSQNYATPACDEWMKVHKGFRPTEQYAKTNTPKECINKYEILTDDEDNIKNSKKPTSVDKFKNKKEIKKNHKSKINNKKKNAYDIEEISIDALGKCIEEYVTTAPDDVVSEASYTSGDTPECEECKYKDGYFVTLMKDYDLEVENHRLQGWYHEMVHASLVEEGNKEERRLERKLRITAELYRDVSDRYNQALDMVNEEFMDVEHWVDEEKKLLALAEAYYASVS